jgi:hypothetical protein
MRDLSKVCVALAIFGASAGATQAQPQAKAPPPAAAVTGPTSDVRCLLTMIALRSQKDQKIAGQGALGVFYFLGRVSTRGPSFDLAGTMKAQAATLAPQQLQAELQRCSLMIQGSQQGLQTSLNALRPPGAPPPGSPPAAGPASAPSAVAPAPAPVAPPR